MATAITAFFATLVVVFGLTVLIALGGGALIASRRKDEERRTKPVRERVTRFAKWLPWALLGLVVFTLGVWLLMPGSEVAVEAQPSEEFINSWVTTLLLSVLLGLAAYAAGSDQWQWARRCFLAAIAVLIGVIAVNAMASVISADFKFTIALPDAAALPTFEETLQWIVDYHVNVIFLTALLASMIKVIQRIRQEGLQRAPLVLIAASVWFLATALLAAFLLAPVGETALVYSLLQQQGVSSFWAEILTLWIPLAVYLALIVPLLRLDQYIARLFHIVRRTARLIFRLALIALIVGVPAWMLVGTYGIESGLRLAKSYQYDTATDLDLAARQQECQTQQKRKEKGFSYDAALLDDRCKAILEKLKEEKEAERQAEEERKEAEQEARQRARSMQPAAVHTQKVQPPEPEGDKFTLTDGEWSPRIDFYEGKCLDWWDNGARIRLLQSDGRKIWWDGGYPDSVAMWFVAPEGKTVTPKYVIKDPRYDKDCAQRLRGGNA